MFSRFLSAMDGPLRICIATWMKCSTPTQYRTSKPLLHWAADLKIKPWFLFVNYIVILKFLCKIIFKSGKFLLYFHLEQYSSFYPEYVHVNVNIKLLFLYRILYCGVGALKIHSYSNTRLHLRVCFFTLP